MNAAKDIENPTPFDALFFQKNSLNQIFCSCEMAASKDLLAKYADLPQVSVKADTLSHLMHCGLRDNMAGKLEGKPMLCVGWIYFKERVPLRKVQEDVLEKLVSRITRYRAIPVERDGWTYFDTIAVGDLDLGYHFEEAGTFDTDESFQEYLESISEQGLDYSKPMWKYIVVDKLPCGRSAVLGIIDHVLGDGASQVSALLSMCEKLGENPLFQKKAASKKPRSRPLSIYERFFAFKTGLVKPLLESVLPADTQTKLKMPPSNLFPTGWRFATTKPGDEMDLKMIKEIKTRVGTGCTVNDVLLALTALVIKEYYVDSNEPIMKTKKDISATYAVNARPAGVNYLSDKWFGNHIVIASTRYPLHETGIETLLQFRDASKLRKASPDTIVRNLLVRTLAGILPRDAIVKISAEATVKFSIMVSNVLLSLDKVRLFGREVDDVQFLAFSPFGCYCGVATYAGKVNCNVVVAKEVDSDPTEMMPYYRKELEKLHAEVMKHDSEYFEKLDKPKSPSWSFYIVLTAIAVSLFLTCFNVEPTAFMRNASFSL